METAMDSLSDKYEFRVRWEPFLLRPNIPYEGQPYPPEYKNPNNPRVQMVLNAAASVGLQFSTKRERFPNTIRAHALLELAKQVEDGAKQNEVAEKLFEKYFTEGDILGMDTLLTVASECGLDRSQAEAFISDKTNIKKTVDRAMSWMEKGISGVPAFYMNGQKVCSGAQDPDTLKRMMEIVAEKYPLAAESKSNI